MDHRKQEPYCNNTTTSFAVANCAAIYTELSGRDDLVNGYMPNDSYSPDDIPPAP